MKRRDGHIRLSGGLGASNSHSDRLAGWWSALDATSGIISDYPQHIGMSDLSLSDFDAERKDLQCGTQFVHAAALPPQGWQFKLAEG